MDNDALREERDRLLDENTKMNTKATTSARDDSSIVRYLRSKVSEHMRVYVAQKRPLWLPNLFRITSHVISLVLYT